MGAIASLDVLSVGKSIELAAQEGQRVVATGVAVAGGGTTSSAFGNNGGNVGIAVADTVIATVSITITAGQAVVLDGVASFQNQSEGLATPAILGLFIDDNGVASSEQQQDEYPAGTTWRNVAVNWRRAGLAPGAHTFRLQGNSTADAGNTQVPAGLGSITAIAVDA